MTENKTGENKRLGILIAVPIVIALIVTAGIVYIFKKSDSNDDQKKVQSNVAISVIEQTKANSLVEAFLDSVGNFGFKEDALNSKNIMDVSYVASTDANQAKSFFVARANAYTSGKKHVYVDAPLYFDANATGSWLNDFDTERISTFALVSSSAVANASGSSLNIDGIDRDVAYVAATFTTVQTVRTKTADDSTWDGTFSVAQKTFSDNAVNFTLIKDNDSAWKIYDITGLANSFVLATWNPPAASAFADSQRGFEQIGMIKSDIVDTVTSKD